MTILLLIVIFSFLLLFLWKLPRYQPQRVFESNTAANADTATPPKDYEEENEKREERKRQRMLTAELNEILQYNAEKAYQRKSES